MIICSIPVSYAIDRNVELERAGHGPFEIMGLICLATSYPLP